MNFKLKGNLICLLIQDLNQTNLTLVHQKKTKRKQKHSGLTWQPAPPSIQTCLHTKKTECSCMRVYVNYVHQKRAPHSSTDRETQFSLGLNVTLLHPHPKKKPLPFLGAFHHQFLIRSHELEFRGMLPNTLQSLPHRSHVSSGTGSFSAPIPP